jgi:hypothetical protein
VAAAGSLNQKQQRQPFPKKASARPNERMSGDLLVMSALIGISRAFLGPKKEGPIGGTMAMFKEGLPGRAGPGSRQADGDPDQGLEGYRLARL